MMNRHANVPESAWACLQQLADAPEIQRLILFGSRACDDHEQRSDIDIAVCAPGLPRTEWARMREAAYTARCLYWISLVHFDRNPPSLKERILSTGVVIYDEAEASG